MNLEQIREYSLHLLAKSKKEKPKLSKQQSNVLESLSGEPFGCQNDKAIAFANAFCDFDVGEILKSQNTKNCHSGMIYIPITNPNSHNYPIGEPTFLVNVRSQRARGFRKSHKDIGNYLPVNWPYLTLRPADETEIDQFFKEISSHEKIFIENIVELGFSIPSYK